MPETSKTPLRREEWNFDESLKDVNLEQVRFCHQYEFGREAFDYDWLEAHSKLTPGESAMLFQNPNVLSEKLLFYMHYFWMFESGIWLKAPYSDLPEEFRAMVADREKSRLSSVIEPRPNLDRGLVQHVELAIPLNASHAYLRTCFAAFLEVHFAKLEPPHSLKKHAFPKGGGEAEIRRLRTDLRSLGAFRLLKYLSIKQATELTKSALGHPLYNNAPSWSLAKKRASTLIKSLAADLDPLIELLSRAPKGVTGFFYDSGSGALRLEYR